MLLLFSLSHWYSVSLPVLLVLGLGSGAFGTMQAAIVVLVARDEMRGRALGVVAVAIGSSPLGSLLVGGVATAVSPSFAVGLNASLGLGFLLLVGLLMPSILQRTEADRPQDETVGLD
jgi:MFS family permease